MFLVKERTRRNHDSLAESIGRVSQGMVGWSLAPFNNHFNLKAVRKISKKNNSIYCNSSAVNLSVPVDEINSVLYLHCSDAVVSGVCSNESDNSSYLCHRGVVVTGHLGIGIADTVNRSTVDGLDSCERC